MIAFVLATMMLTPAPAEVELWRLDCGSIDEKDFAAFSDSHRYDGKPYKLTDSCYLIRHGDEYLLWDTGLPGALEGQVMTDPSDGATYRLKQRLVPQLAKIGVTPAQIKYVGISHRHADHTGQALDFANATLLIGAEDFDALKVSTDAMDTGGVKPWLEGRAKLDPVKGDRDVFGDGSVTMLDMPGHTAGHHALLVRLKAKGWVLLSGDQFHAAESYAKNEVPSFNTDRADTLASSDRFRNIAANLKATVIVQHEPGDIAKLPIFPESAR
jgi:glyoxylase-like metal-dependent hydrolase (beta-lactamase superfamily II)